MKSIPRVLVLVVAVCVVVFALNRVREVTGFCWEEGRVLSDAELHDLALPLMKTRVIYGERELAEFPYYVEKFHYPREEGALKFDLFRRAFRDNYVSEINFVGTLGYSEITVDECGRLVGPGIF